MSTDFSFKKLLGPFIGLPQIYATCARQAAVNLARNWIVIPASLLAFVFFSVTLGLFGKMNMGLAGGFIAGLIQIALLTLYYFWISETAERHRLTLKELLTFDSSLFSSIINVGFIFFLAQLVIESFSHGATSIPIMLMVSLAISLVFNPIAEVIQQRRGDGLGSLKEAYSFIQENWIEWFGPFVLMLLPWIWISPAGPLSALSQTNPLLPAAPLVWGAQQVGTFFGGYGATIPALLVGVVLANWFMVFRSLLYRALGTTSRRKRAYQFKNS